MLSDKDFIDEVVHTLTNDNFIDNSLWKVFKHVDRDTKRKVMEHASVCVCLV